MVRPWEAPSLQVSHLDAETGLEWQSDSCLFVWSSQRLRLGMRREDGLIWELRKAVISVPWYLRLDATRGADSATGSRGALVLF